MSLESVQQFFQTHAPDVTLIVREVSTATVALAAAALGVAEAQIAKTLALKVGETRLLLVTAGTGRLDNQKAKAVFGGKPSMLAPDQVLALTSHAVGGVCPFGLPAPVPVYCDVSLRAFTEVYPAAGSNTSAVRLTPERLAALTEAQWVDVCRFDQAPGPVGSQP